MKLFEEFINENNKKKWDDASKEERKKMLKKVMPKVSDKFIDWDWEDLTPEIKDKLKKKLNENSSVNEKSDHIDNIADQIEKAEGVENKELSKEVAKMRYGNFISGDINIELSDGSYIEKFPKENNFIFIIKKGRYKGSYPIKDGKIIGEDGEITEETDKKTYNYIKKTFNKYVEDKYKIE